MKHFLQSRRETGETEQPHFETQNYQPVCKHLLLILEADHIYMFQTLSSNALITLQIANNNVMCKNVQNTAMVLKLEIVNFKMEKKLIE